MVQGEALEVAFLLKIFQGPASNFQILENLDDVAIINLAPGVMHSEVQNPHSSSSLM